MSSSACRRPGLRGDRRGATAVEFALISLIFVFLLLGTVELGRYYFTFQSLRSATGEAARVALTSIGRTLFNGQPCPSTLSPDYTAVLQKAPFLRQPPLEITVTPTCGSNPRSVTASATYTFNFLVPFLPVGTLTMSDSTILHFP